VRTVVFDRNQQGVEWARGWAPIESGMTEVCGSDIFGNLIVTATEKIGYS